VSELHNVARMVQRGALTPGHSSFFALSHYPRPSDANRFAERLDRVLPTISRGRLEGMPQLADMVAREFLQKLSLCAACEGLLSKRVLDEATMKVKAWTERGNHQYTSEEELLLSWEVMGHFCKISTVAGFIQGQIMERLHAATSSVSDPHQVLQILRTDSPHRANAILYAAYYPTRMIHAEHPDWLRMRNSLSLRVQGSIVAGDTRPEELLFDVSCRLGMPTDVDIEEQLMWMERRMDSLVWITKMIRQGCFASLMFVIGTALFGEDFPMILMATGGTGSGHRLEISASEGSLSVTTSVRFNIHNLEMDVVGELPLSMRLSLKLATDGTIQAFQMSADVEMQKCPVDWNALALRAQPLLV